MIGTIFALLSAVSAGSAVVLVRKVSNKSTPFNISLITTLIGVIILWPIAILFTDWNNLSLIGALLFILAGAFSPCVARLLFYRGMQTLGAPINSSIFATYSMYVSLLAVLLLGETLTLTNWFGILCVIVGVITIQIFSKADDGHTKHLGKGLLISLVAALSVALSYFVRKVGLDICFEPVLGAAVGYTFSLALYSLVLSMSETQRHSLLLKRDLGLFWKAALLMSVSWILSFYAVGLERVSIVTTLLQLEPMFVLLFASLYLKELEHFSRKLSLSVVLIILGIALVYGIV